MNNKKLPSDREFLIFWYNNTIMKKHLIKALNIILLLALLLSLASCGSAPAANSEAKPDVTEEEPDRYEGLPRLEGAEVAGRYALYKGSERLANDLVCIGNRPYIFADYCENLGELSWPLYEDETGVYMALVDFVASDGTTVEFIPEDESVHYYYLEAYPWAEEAKEYMAAADADPDTKAAYIRLEDVMADNGASGRYTDFELMRTRVMVDYLADHSRAFYIAWIPVYVNPGAGIRNNIATDFSFYNADFVFTLDHMQKRGGKLGLHGLTHQYGNSVSADGVEFGGRNNRGKDDLYAIFDEAAGYCHSLGYEYYFFEFPHYDATKFEKDVAEQYFDIMYEYYMSKKEGVIERHELGDHTCLWVPTPADYVYDPYDKDGIIARLDSNRRHGMILSMFLHPAMDLDRFEVHTDGENRRFAYYEPTGILKGLFTYLAEQGYIFDEIK